MSVLESASPLRRRTVDCLVVWTAVVLGIAKKVAAEVYGPRNVVKSSARAVS